MEAWDVVNVGQEYRGFVSVIVAEALLEFAFGEILTVSQIHFGLSYMQLS